MKLEKQTTDDCNTYRWGNRGIIIYETTVDGATAYIEYVRDTDFDSYVTRILKIDQGLYLYKSFGNGVLAQRWIKDTLDQTVSFLILKYT